MKRLFQWIVPGTAGLREHFDKFDAVAGIACPIVDLPRLGDAAREAGAGGGPEVIFSPQAWRVQLEPEHRGRRALEHFGLDWRRGEEFDPELDEVAPDLVAEIAERNHQAQVSAAGSGRVSPSHHYKNQLGPGRDLDVALAHRFSEIARSRLPADPDERPAVITEIAFAPARAGSSTISGLLARYREVECDAYWLCVWGVEGMISARAYERVRELAKRLEIETQRPCVVQGLRSLSVGALANGVAGACVGWGSTIKLPKSIDEQKREDDRRRRRAEEQGKDPGRWPVIVPLAFAEVLGAVPDTDKSEVARRKLLRGSACACGAHGRGEEPKAQMSRHRHNFAVDAGLAASIGALEPDQARVVLGEWVERAASLRAELELSPLWRGWGEALRQGNWGELYPRLESDELFWAAGH